MSAEKTSNTTWILSSSKECSAVSGKMKQSFIYQGGTIITRCVIRQQAYISVDNCFIRSMFLVINHCMYYVGIR